MCESYVQPYSKPCSSAFCINSISRVYGGSGKTVTPKVRAIGDEHTPSRREFQPPICETGDVITHFWAFVGVSAVVIVTPGQDTALTIRNTLLGGRRSGMLTAAGVSGGQAMWALATSAGVAAVLQASEPAFVAVKVAGATYLVYLGLQTLVPALRRGARKPKAPPRGRPFRQGIVSNLGNPKMAVFFPSLLPQFATRPSFGALLLL